MFDSEDMVVVYTRKQAIEDGVLVDVSNTATEAGFKVSVAVTESLFQNYLQPGKELESFGQSLEGRLWDLLFMLYMSSRNSDSSTIHFKVLFLMDPKKTPEEVDLKAILGPGDQGEPVLTIMLPHED